MIELIPFTEPDIDRLLGWVVSRQDFLFWAAATLEYPLTREGMLRHLEQSARAGDWRIFKAVDAETQDAVGYLELTLINPDNRSLRISRVVVAPAARGRGIGGALMGEAVRIAFEELGVHRAELGVFHVNPGAIACYERAGFRQEGVRRDSFKVPGENSYWSEVVMSILAPEWAPFAEPRKPLR
jgi:RimJ/RimL family protein N-acetyltransferase